MDTILQVFSYISGLGNYLLIPVMIFIIGLFVRLKLIKSLRAGLTVGIGLVGLDLVLGLVWSNIGPVVNLMVDKFNLNLSTIDTGWGTAAGLAFSTTVGAFIIPFILVINIIMLALRATRTMNIDVWNYWHYAFSGATVYLLTNNIVYGFLAATAHCVISLIIADRTAEMVQKEMGLPGISIPQGYAVSTVPVFMVLEKLYNIVLPNKIDSKEDKLSSIENNAFLAVLKEPIFLGMIIGSILGFSVGYDVPTSLKLGVSMAALLFILPRMIKILMEGLLPISEQARAYMSKKYAGQQFYIGLDSAVLLGHPTTVAVGLLLIPITLGLSMIIPWNGTLPLGDLAATAFFVSMASIIHKGKFLRTLISGTIMMVIVLSVATFFAPQLTAFVGSGSVTIPEGATQITALSAGNLIAFILYELSSFGIVGVVAVVLVIVGIAYSGRVYLSKQLNLNTTEFKTGDAIDYLNK